MAFNNGIQQALKDPGENVILKRPTCEYYIEWWKLGTDERDIEAGRFRTNNLKHFVKLFGGFEDLSMVFLERCHDSRVLLDKRIGSRQV